MLRRLSVAMVFLELAASLAGRGQSPATAAYATSVARVPTPDYTGKTLEEVQAANATGASGRALFAAVIPTGTTGGVVASQSPAAGVPVFPGAQRLVVKLNATGGAGKSFWTQLVQGMVSSASQTRKVPDLTGDNQNEARGELSALNLMPRFVGDEGGVVSGVEPPTGSDVKVGSTVTVTLQTPRVVVPPLLGLNRDAAAGALAEHSLRLGTVSGADEDSSTVVEQSIPAGTEEPQYTVVNVTMQVPTQTDGSGSAGQGQAPDQPKTGTKKVPPGKGTSKLVPVPSVRGMDLKRATLVLQKAGLKVGEQTGDVVRGVVSDQSPMFRAQVPRGSAVALTFEVPPPPQRAPWAPAVVLLGVAGGILWGGGAGVSAMRARRLIRGLGGVPEFRLDPQGRGKQVSAKKMVVRLTVRIRTQDVGQRVEAAREPVIQRGRVTHGD